MHLTFNVGIAECHTVTFTYSKVWGGLTISVDGVNVVKTLRFASVGLVKSFDFRVGDAEHHDVRIELHRARLFAGFRPQPVFAYVDGRLAATGIA